MALNLVFLGPPGAGKGSIAEAIVKKYGLTHISTGELIRAEVAAKTALGKRLEKIINAGNLVSNGDAKSLVEKKVGELKKKGNFKGIIFDGYPRSLVQAEGFEELLDEFNEKISAVVYIGSSEEQIVKRLSARRHCPKCKKDYNMISGPPKLEGKCDTDGAKIVRRKDDEPETIKKRYRVFLEETAPVIGFFEKKGLLKKYDGNAPLQESIARAEKIVAPLFTKP
jgi:adenylate kinase